MLALVEVLVVWWFAWVWALGGRPASGSPPAHLLDALQQCSDGEAAACDDARRALPEAAPADLVRALDEVPCGRIGRACPAELSGIPEDLVVRRVVQLDELMLDPGTGARFRAAWLHEGGLTVRATVGRHPASIIAHLDPTSLRRATWWASGKPRIS